jgi:hypothetical protein
MYDVIGKWVQSQGQPFEGLWFEFKEDGTFIAEYEPLGITSSGTYTLTGTGEPDGDQIIIHQTQHTLNLTGEFKGLIAIKDNRLLMALAASPGGPSPEDLSEARVYTKEE